MIYAFEDFELDTRLFALKRAGKPRSIEPQVFNLLAYLISRRDRVVSKDELLKAVWPGRIVAESTLNSRIKSARKALDDNGAAQRIIATFHRRGYRFLAVVEERPVGSSEATRDEPAACEGGDSGSALTACALLHAMNSEADRAGLAVIPFSHNPGSAQAVWLAETLTEDISTHLARIPGFMVISRNSTFFYKDREIGLRQMGQDLGVRYLVEGSLWEIGDLLRVSVQLMDAVNGQLLWADSRQIAAASLYDLQQGVVREIVSRIEPEILRAEFPALRRRRPVDLGAWALYRQAQGTLTIKGWSEDAFADALLLLRQAIRKDPELAFAHAYLALMLAIGHLMGMVADSGSEDEARLAAENALCLDSQDSDVLGYVGCAFADLGDTLRGIGLLERAVELDPSNAQARAALGAALLKAGNVQGIEHMRHGLRISPRDSRLAVWGALLARGLLNHGRVDEAIQAARCACRGDDKVFLPRIVLAVACAKAGAISEAAAALADARRIRPRLSLLDMSSMASEDELEALERSAPHSSFA